ncbi:hypothetical protein FRX31_016348 [Thalictrum thalictroides]|uniref:Uncharacterized protein n=1 Tax=Thalictrum thalictroides TaxID=46969 RepID=A0A7J6WCG0_THATH|nr:hypothetical protein FRX31_016348 [Thalictrum thalictroides]
MVGNKDNKQDVLDFLSRVPFEHWANAHFLGSRYGDMCSSIVEIINSRVGEERFLPIASISDRIRSRLMNQFSERRTCGNGRSSLICPTKENKLKEKN